MHFDDLSMIVRGRQEDGIKIYSKVSSLGILGVGIHQHPTSVNTTEVELLKVNNNFNFSVSLHHHFVDVQ